MRLTATLSLLALGAACSTPYVPPDDSETNADDTGADASDDVSDDASDPSDDSDPVDTSDTSVVDDGGPLRCIPATTRLQVSGGVAQDLQLTAEEDQGGSWSPASGVTWHLLTGPGTVSPTGLYRTPTDHGGRAEVRVSRGSRVATCVVEVEADATLNPAGDPGLPGAFGGSTPGTSGSCAAIIYPLADSAMPGSFAAPLIQWTQGGANRFELVLESEWTTLRVYLTGDSFRPTPQQWWGLTRDDPGTEVSLTLTAGSWSGGGFSGGTCRAGAPTRIEVTDATINGTIVYWAPPITKSLSFDANTAATLDRVALPGNLCHGCHTVNLAKPMRMTYGPDFPGKTNLVDLGSPSNVLKSWGNGFTDMKDYAAPDPTGAYVVISGMALASGSKMKLYSQTSGAEMQTLSTARAPTMPNWSPDGSKLVYAGCDGGASALSGANCDLYIQTWDASSNRFSGEQLLVARGANQTLYYPSFSPDSRWVAFNAAEQWTNADGELQSSNANPKAKLMLVSATGGSARVLDNANGVGDLTNSWPRWAPAAGDYAWLAWSTTRAYGHQVQGRAQLWVSGIDLTAAQAGSADPSLPPVWIPGQLTTEANHTPTWLPRYR